jgi:hypothetical protein
VEGPVTTVDDHRAAGARARPGTFVDPRTGPSPLAPRPASRLTTDVAELAGLHKFCRSGRLYDVESWIRAGKPLQLASPSQSFRRHETALGIAFERDNQALVWLLVVNGYDLALEPESPLDEALRRRRTDLLDLLLDWGADPHRVDLDVLFETYDSQLFHRFQDLGVDLGAGRSLAYALGFHEWLAERCE